MNLDFGAIKDPVIRDIVRQVVEQYRGNPLSRGQWRFYELVIQKAVAGYQYAHGLGFVPKDVLVSSQVGAGLATFAPASFDRTNIVLSTTGPVTVRFFLGRYDENSEA